MYPLDTSKLLKSIMQDYYTGMASGQKKVAWCTSVGPAELLRSFDFEVYFPENHGALIGTSRKAEEFIPVSVNRGYSREICSYLTSDIGAYLGGSTPLARHYGLEKIPKPDLIVYNTNQCREVQDWFSFYSKEFGCPIAGVHPPRHLKSVGIADIEDVSAQFRALVPTCEAVSGKKFDPGKFGETLKLSREASALWKACLQTAKHSPAPLSFFDGTIQMGPIVVLRGTETAGTYYEVLLKELNANIDEGAGFLERETCRIYWEGMPIWGKLRSLADLFIKNEAAVVASTYCNSWVFDDFDERRPFESSALAYTNLFINRSEEAKMEMLKDLIEEYRIDGMIFHDAKTCFNNSNARFGMPSRIREETGIETLVIEGDLCDMRFFSEGQSVTKIETFIDQMK